jgi:hypothetical protein
MLSPKVLLVLTGVMRQVTQQLRFAPAPQRVRKLVLLFRCHALTSL